MPAMGSMEALKEEGNREFQAGHYELALAHYTQGLLVCSAHVSKDRATLLKNRAACHLKLADYESAVEDASAALELAPSDGKALFRRAQALEQLGRPEEAYRDVVQLVRLEPRDKAAQALAQRLTVVVQEKAKQQQSMDGRVSQMLQIAFGSDVGIDEEKRKQALNNLLVLAREEAGAGKLFEAGVTSKLIGLLDSKDADVLLAVLRILSALVNNSRSRAAAVLNEVGGQVKVSSLFGSGSSEICTAAGCLVQSLLNGVSAIDKFRKEKKKLEDERSKNPESHDWRSRAGFKPLQLSDTDWAIVDGVFNVLIKLINSNKLSGHGRDSVLEVLIKNVDSKDGFNWTRKFLDTDGVSRALEVAGMLPDRRATLAMTRDTRMHCSALLSKLWEDTTSDQQRDKFRQLCSTYFSEMFGDVDMDSKLEAIVAVTALLQGPFDLGNHMIANAGVIEIMMALADSPDAFHQKIAVEALVQSASKKDKCSGALRHAVPLLKKLYQTSTDDSVKARALVGLCKLGSVGGTDASAKSLADGSTLTLSRACKKFLTNPAKDFDLRRWACEGLAYLSLDADVKDELATDQNALTCLVELARGGDQTVLYPAASVLVNLTNSYDKPEVSPELLELAKYAHHHIPEDHPKDKPEFVKQRIDNLVKADAAGALVALCKTTSANCKELLSRVFLALVTEPQHRGVVVQQGGGKALIPLSLDNTDTGRHLAAQALAKIAITINPEVAFPGQRILEVVRPLLHLLHPERTALQNFEALLALTNLASVSDGARKRIVLEKGLSDIEKYALEEHEMLRRAAMECLCNLTMNEEVQQAFLGENDRVKMFVLFCGDDQFEVQRAAAGGLAMLTSSEPAVCDKIVQVSSWKERLLQPLVAEHAELRHRAAHIIANLVARSRDIAEMVVGSQLFEVLLAVSKLPEPEYAPARACAEQALLAAASKWQLIQETAAAAATHRAGGGGRGGET